MGRPSHPIATLYGVFTLSLDAPSSGCARLRPSGHLDASAARDVLHAAAGVVRCGCSALVLDLDGLESWDADAAYAVVGCTRLARFLPEGVDVVAERAPGLDLARHVGVATSRAAWAPDALRPDTMAACHAS